MARSRSRTDSLVQKQGVGVGKSEIGVGKAGVGESEWELKSEVRMQIVIPAVNPFFCRLAGGLSLFCEWPRGGTEIGRAPARQRRKVGKVGVGKVGKSGNWGRKGRSRTDCSRQIRVGVGVGLSAGFRAPSQGST
eukprot:gene25652-biopygen13542